MYILTKTLKPVVKRPSSVDVDEVKLTEELIFLMRKSPHQKRTDRKKNHQKMRNLMRMNPRLRKVLPARHIMVHKVKTFIIK